MRHFNTMDLTGEYEDQRYIITRGDARIAITISRNEHTVRMNRKTRFIIDDPESPYKLAFTLSKPLMVGKTIDGKGVLAFVCSETQTTDDDDVENMVADYYKYHPRDIVTNKSEAKKAVIDPSQKDDRGRENWL